MGKEHMTKATFEICGQRYEGWHYPTSTWNGFANPYLERDEFLRWMDALIAGDEAAGFDASSYTVQGADVLYTLASSNEDEPEDSMSFGPDEDGLYFVGMGYTWEVVA